ncbi:hypothetical protein PWG68_19500, partial [Chromobacterium amazonense]
MELVPSDQAVKFRLKKFPKDTSEALYFTSLPRISQQGLKISWVSECWLFEPETENQIRQK